MKNYINIIKGSIAITAILFCLVSCGEDPFSTTLEIDPPEHTPRLVVHAYGSTVNGIVRVQVSESKGILDDTSTENISDAVVTIWSGSNMIATVPEVGNISGFNYFLEDENLSFAPGETYRIEVEAIGYPKAVGSCTVPQFVPILSTRFEEDGPETDDFNESSEIEIDINDPADTENFYEVVAVYGQESGGNLFFNEIFTDSFDPATEAGINFRALIMKDISFDGESKNIPLIIDKFSIQEAEEHLYVLWRNTTEAHYLFNRTANSQDEQDGNPFSSPVQVYSNMENGIGIFSIVNEQIIKVEI